MMLIEIKSGLGRYEYDASCLDLYVRVRLLLSVVECRCIKNLGLNDNQFSVICMNVVV